jgi:hypothetical protein
MNERLKLRDIVETEEDFQEIEIEQNMVHNFLAGAIVSDETSKCKKHLTMVIEEGNKEEENSERKDQEEEVVCGGEKARQEEPEKEVIE